MSSDQEAFSQRPNWRDRGIQYNYDVKGDILEFEGKHHPDDFIDWLNTEEIIFHFRDILDQHKLKLIVIKLKRYASNNVFVEV